MLRGNKLFLCGVYADSGEENPVRLYCLHLMNQFSLFFAKEDILKFVELDIKRKHRMHSFAKAADLHKDDKAFEEKLSLYRTFNVQHD